MINQLANLNWIGVLLAFVPYFLLYAITGEAPKQATTAASKASE